MCVAVLQKGNSSANDIAREANTDFQAISLEMTSQVACSNKCVNYILL